MLIVHQVYRDSQHLCTVEHETPRLASSQTDDSSAQSPTSNTQTISNGQPSLSLGTSEWSSPAFSHRSRLSLGPLSISTFDPFAEEDGYVPGKGRKRARFSLLSSEWTFAESSPSPTKANASDPFENFDVETGSDGSQSVAMGDDLAGKSIPDGGLDIPTRTDASPAPNDSGPQSFQNVPEGLDVFDAQDEGLHDSTTPKPVAQSEEREGSTNYTIADEQGETSAVAEPDLSDQDEEPNSGIPYPIVNEPDTGIPEPATSGTPENRTTETPRLRPIASPGLPLVSPLNTGSGTPIDQPREYAIAATSHPTEEITGPAYQDVEMTDVAPDEGMPSKTQQVVPELPEAVEVAATSYDQAATRDVCEELQEYYEEQAPEAEIEHATSPESTPEIPPEASEYVTFEEQVFEQAVHESSNDRLDLAESEREDETASTSSEDRDVEMDREEQSRDEDESGSSSSDVEEHPQEDYDKVEIDQENVESDEDLRNSEDESQVSDGEYEMDDVAPPFVAQAQTATVTSQQNVIVLDSDDESLSGAEDEGIKQDGIESQTMDAEEQSEVGDIKPTGEAEVAGLTQPHICDAADLRAIDNEAELGSETEELTDNGGVEDVESAGPHDVVQTEIEPSNETHAGLADFAPETSYHRSPSFTPSAESTSGQESVGEEVIDPQLFQIQKSAATESPPGKNERPRGLSLDGSWSSPPEEQRQNPLFGMRSPSFLKDQPLTPLASQEVPSSPSQQLQFSLETLPILPTPQASQDAIVTHAQPESIITARRDLNESSMENRINIFKNFRLQNKNHAEASESQDIFETQLEKENQLELKDKLAAEVQVENDDQAPAESVSESEFQSAQASQAGEQDEHRPVLKQPTVKSEPAAESEPATEVEPTVESEPVVKSEPVVDSESDVSASQPDASTSPETTSVPEISGDVRKPEEQLVNGAGKGITDGEVSSAKDKSPQEAADDTLLTPYPVKTPKPEPNRHATGLRTSLSYYAPLSALVDSFNTLIDTLSIVISVSQPQRAKSGTRDYYTTIQVTDPSLNGRTTTAQIFRRYKRAIPRPVQGDIILLRNFKVCAFNHTMMLQSVESSSWAVFNQGEPDAMKTTGPPVEVGDEEKEHVAELRKLYVEGVVAVSETGSIRTSRASTGTFSTASSESGAIDNRTRGGSTPRRSRRGRSSTSRRVTIHELRNGRRYTDSGSDRDSIHELRDGTLYVNP